uniref:Uncharacterized protein n=1 Tax=Hucho hucho TaxID=62062 RepID=A0A4W5JYK8_9TELE
MGLVLTVLVHVAQMEMERVKTSDSYQVNLNRVLAGLPLPLHPLPLPLNIHTRLSSGSSSSPCTPAMQRAAIQQNANLHSSRDSPHSSSMSDMATSPMSPMFDDVFWDFQSSVECPPKVPERTTSKFYCKELMSHHRTSSSGGPQSPVEKGGKSMSSHRSSSSSSQSGLCPCVLHNYSLASPLPLSLCL